MSELEEERKKAEDKINQGTQTEEQMVNEAPTELNLEKIINDTFNMEGANVKAVIGPRGDRVSRIREITGVKKVELNQDRMTFTVIGTVPSQGAWKEWEKRPRSHNS